jgi:hypothetical protein
MKRALIEAEFAQARRLPASLDECKSIARRVNSSAAYVWIVARDRNGGEPPKPKDALKAKMMARR